MKCVSRLEYSICKATILGKCLWCKILASWRCADNQVLKHTGGRYKSKPGEPLHRIPFQLAMAAETFLLDRMSLGEEIGYDFVESVIRQLLEIWNDKIEEFKSQVIEVVGPDVLAEQDKKIQAHVSDDEVAGIEEETANRINALVEALTPIDISHNFQALRQLGGLF